MTRPVREPLGEREAARPQRRSAPADSESAARPRPDAGRRLTSAAGARNLQRLAGNRAVSALLGAAGAAQEQLPGGGPEAPAAADVAAAETATAATPTQVAAGGGTPDDAGLPTAPGQPGEAGEHASPDAVPALPEASVAFPAGPLDAGAAVPAVPEPGVGLPAGPLDGGAAMGALAGAEVLPAEAAISHIGAEELAVEPEAALAPAAALPPPVAADSAAAGQPVSPEGAALGGADGLPVQRFVGLAEPVAAEPAAEVPAVAMEAPEAGLTGLDTEAQSQAGTVGAAAGSPSGGGLLASLLSRAASWVSGKVSSVTGALGAIGGRLMDVLRSPVAAVTDTARGVLQGARDGVAAALGAVSGGITAVLEGARAAVHGGAQAAFGAARNLMRTLAGPIGAAVRRAITTARDIAGSVADTVTNAAQSVFHRLLDLPNRIAAAATQAVTALQTAVTGMTARFGAALGSVTGRVASGLDAAVAAAGNVVQTVIAGARRLLGGVPGVLASLVRPIVDRLLAAVSAFAARIQAAARRAVDRVRALVQRAIAGFTALVQRAVAAAADALRRRIAATRDMVNRGIQLALAAARRAVAAAGAAVRRAVHAVLGPIREFLVHRLAAWLGPKIKQAIAAIPPAVLAARLQAAAMAQRAMQLARSAVQAAGRVAEKINDAVTIEEHDVLRGLMKPDGDHFAFGVSIEPELEVGVGAGATIAATVDAVVDYASHEIGLFISPALSAGVSGGLEAAVGQLDATASWGTVLSFGANRRAGVRAGYQGAFENVSVAARAAAVGGVSMGSNFYVGAAPLRHAVAPLVSAAERDPHLPETRPGTPTTTPGIPAGPLTPLPPRELTRQTVFFDTGQAQVRPEGVAAVHALVDAVAAAAATHPDARFTITTVGGASLRWRHPDRAGAAADNLRLSWQRADAVNALVAADLAARGLAGRVSVREDATGSEQAEQDAARLHLSADDDSQAYRDTVVSADEIDMTQTPAVPPTVGPAPTESQHPSPGGWTWDAPTTPMEPGHVDLGGDDRPGQGFYDPRQPGSPFHPGDSNVLDPTNGPLVPDLLNRPTIGWDTFVAPELEEGAGVGASASAGASFSFPLGAYAFPPEAAAPLRVLFGMIKLDLDLESLSVGGGLRDVAGVVGAFVPDEVVNGVADTVFPLPPGYTD